VGRQGGSGGARGRNDPNNVCTYEYMNKEKNALKNLIQDLKLGNYKTDTWKIHLKMEA
jgi:hypothetical protein